jgi:hypothetical protein
MAWGRRPEPEEAWTGERWEYHHTRFGLRTKGCEQYCTALGAQGWELVTALPLATGHDPGFTTEVDLIFKRRVR